MRRQSDDGGRAGGRRRPQGRGRLALGRDGAGDARYRFSVHRAGRRPTKAAAEAGCISRGLSKVATQQQLRGRASSAGARGDLSRQSLQHHDAGFLPGSPTGGSGAAFHTAGPAKVPPQRRVVRHQGRPRVLLLARESLWSRSGWAHKGPGTRVLGTHPHGRETAKRRGALHPR